MFSQALRALKYRRRIRAAQADLARRLERAGPGRPHGRNRPLIVSLTSYPARFGTLADTLGCLLTQTVAADATILWLAHGDGDALPAAVRALTPRGLRIEHCPDWRSYKKLVPSLMAHPDADIVTADDDVVYAADWLERLIEAPDDVTCHRAHRITLTAEGLPRPYAEWDYSLSAPARGPLIFPTGVSGVLYPAGCLHPDTTRDDLFMDLAPGADDVWFHFMQRLTGAAARKIGGKTRILEWPSSQQVSLRADNHAGGGNDRAMQAVTARYGFPAS